MSRAPIDWRRASLDLHEVAHRLRAEPEAVVAELVRRGLAVHVRGTLVITSHAFRLLAGWSAP